jgi:hypothetical protein
MSATTTVERAPLRAVGPSRSRGTTTEERNESGVGQ